MFRIVLCVLGLVGTLGAFGLVAAQDGTPSVTPGVTCASPVAASPYPGATPLGGVGPTDASPATPLPGATPGSTADICATPEAGSVVIESIDIAYVQTEVAIPADTLVTIVLPNLGGAIHNFSIDALDINIDLFPGDTESVLITAPAGTYEFYCAIPGHKAAGMVGTLTVE